ncbi:MAG: histidine kinase [Betaproteobacteria bacterium]
MTPILAAASHVQDTAGKTLSDDPKRLPSLPWRKRLSSRAGTDFLLVLCLVLVYGLLAHQLDLSEKLIEWLNRYEPMQLDEMPLTLLLLSMGLTWFAWRRITEVSALLQSNRALTQMLLSTQEQERRALARELHDELGQTSTAVRIDIAYVRKVMHSNPQSALKALQDLDDNCQRMQELSRDLLTRLRPPQLDELGLEVCLRELCKRWQDRHQIACEVQMDALPARLNEAIAIHLYRIIQEALTNIGKHALASTVSIELRLSASMLSLCISDDGRGLPASGPDRGMGMLGMRERIECLQGHIQFEDAQPGLRISLQLPLPQSPA